MVSRREFIAAMAALPLLSAPAQPAPQVPAEVLASWEEVEDVFGAPDQAMQKYAEELAKWEFVRDTSCGSTCTFEKCVLWLPDDTPILCHDVAVKHSQSMRLYKHRDTGQIKTMALSPLMGRLTIGKAVANAAVLLRLQLQLDVHHPTDLRIVAGDYCIKLTHCVTAQWGMTLQPEDEPAAVANDIAILFRSVALSQERES